MKSFYKIFLSLLFFTLQTLYTLGSYAQLVSDFKVNDDLTSNNQLKGKLGLDSAGNFVVVWEDSRNNLPNIYAQLYSKNAVPIGNNFLITDSLAFSPSVSVLKNGDFGVCWNYYFVKFRIYDKNGIPITNEIKVSDTTIVEGPVIGSDENGNFVIAWQQYFGSGSNVESDIFFQRFDSFGNKIGVNKKVNDDSNYRQQYPDLTVQKEGSFIITWQDNRNLISKLSDDIYMQTYDKNGNKTGINIKVNDDTSRIDRQYNPLISCDTSGKFCIVYNNFNVNDNESDIYCQLFNKDGSKMGNNLFIVTSIEEEFSLAIAKKDNGDFVVGYVENLFIERVQYLLRFTSSGIPIGSKFRVTSQAPFLEKGISDVKIYKDKIFSVWNDERNGNFDIYCNVRSFSNPDTTVNIIQTSSFIPENFTLFQNYPNPFNPVTNLEFGIIEIGICNFKCL